MNIRPFRPDISFSRIDNPIEAFNTPPNDPLVGLLMDTLPKDNIEITGHIGEKSFAYNYMLKNKEIQMKGEFDGQPFECSGLLGKEVKIKGHIGENILESLITPQVQGPLTESHTGDMTVTEKIDFNIATGEFKINGRIGEDLLEETIKNSEDGTKVIGRGFLGEWNISREVVRIDKGFSIKGTIGDVEFEKKIVSKK